MARPATVSVLVAQDRVDAPLVRGGQDVEILITPFTEALAAAQHLAGTRSEPLVLVVGPASPHPVPLARSLHEAALQAHIIMVAESGAQESLKKLLYPMPQLGAHWSIASPGAGLAQEVREAARAARQRLRLRTTLDRINLALARPPTGAEDVRRLVASDRFLATLLENASDAMFSLDENDHVLFWNKAGEALFGITPEQAVGRPLQQVVPLEVYLVLGEAIATVRSRKEVVRSSVTYPWHGGRVQAVDLTVAGVRAESEHPIAISVTARDVTEERQAADNLQRANAELERFVSIASHDLKEPLRGIARLAFFIRQDQEHLSEESGERLERIDALCKRLTAMINGLLEYARSGGERLNQACDLNKIVRSSLDQFEEQIRSDDIEIVENCDLPTVAGDPVLLERVFVNLIQNAIKHNPASPRRVEVGCEGQAIFVRDNGPGIDPRFHERIFDLFKRASPPTTEGVGLGLALSRAIIRSHKGRMWVDSAPGKGSTFYIEFPGVLAPTTETDPRPSA